MECPRPDRRRPGWVGACLLVLVCAAVVTPPAGAQPPPSDGNAQTVPTADAAQLLTARVREIHAATPLRRFPLGTGSDGLLRFSRGWTRGFWPGTLWRASDLSGGRFADWALRATVANFGHERRATHDLGFIYGESSVAAYRRLCPDAQLAKTCARLRASGLTAARTLLGIARSAHATGLITTMREGCSDCESPWTGEAIVDSMMNLELLYWAAHETGSARYLRAARAHATRIAQLLERADGSTAQAVEVSRFDGTPLSVHTHQGLSDVSTWARGEGWSLYGFADAGRELRDASFVRVAEDNARYVARRLPASGVPAWDYDAPAGAPQDVSAGVITADGLFHLAAACRALPAACAEPARWLPLARRMLAAALANVRTVAPVGFMGGQVYTFGGETWDDDAELVFGLDYALEAIALDRRSMPGR